MGFAFRDPGLGLGRGSVGVEGSLCIFPGNEF